MEEEENEERMEEDMERQEEYEDAELERIREGEADYPRPTKNESLYNLFHEVLEIEDSSKVANLSEAELGSLSISVRDCQRIALLADMLHHRPFAQFFARQSQLILRTSSSKKGWFAELFVSSKKLTTRASTQRFEQQEPRRNSRWNFGLGKKQVQGPV